jgi:hypothetical protein
MRLSRKALRCFASLLGVAALFGMAAPARAIPQWFTFAGPVTFAQTCFDGEFAPPCEGGAVPPGQGGTITYTFLVDFARRGERIIREPSGETTVTLLDGTFFAQFPNDGPVFGEWGPPPFRVHTDEHIGSGLTLHDLTDVTAAEAGSFNYQTFSSRDVYGLPGSTFSIGSQFGGLQIDFIHAVGGVSTVRSEVDSLLTLTEIHGVPEPDAFSPMMMSLIVLLSVSPHSRRWLRRLRRPTP